MKNNQASHQHKLTMKTYLMNKTVKCNTQHNNNIHKTEQSEEEVLGFQPDTGNK